MSQRYVIQATVTVGLNFRSNLMTQRFTVDGAATFHDVIEALKREHEADQRRLSRHRNRRGVGQPSAGSPAPERIATMNHAIEQSNALKSLVRRAADAASEVRAQLQRAHKEACSNPVLDGGALELLVLDELEKAVTSEQRLRRLSIIAANQKVTP